MQRAIEDVARHRGVRLRPLAQVLDGYAGLAHGAWSAWRRRSNSDHLPDAFGVVLDAVIQFADPVLTGTTAGPLWDQQSGSWV